MKRVGGYNVGIKILLQLQSVSNTYGTLGHQPSVRAAADGSYVAIMEVQSAVESFQQDFPASLQKLLGTGCPATRALLEEARQHVQCHGELYVGNALGPLTSETEILHNAAHGGVPTGQRWSHGIPETCTWAFLDEHKGAELKEIDKISLITKIRSVQTVLLDRFS